MCEDSVPATPSEVTERSGESGRAAFHQQHQVRAETEAQRLFAARAQLGGRWLAWVAGELYALKPAAYAQMVRRELQRLSA